MPSSRSAAALLGALVVVTGCLEHSPIQPEAPGYVVHAVLDAGARDQIILVERTQTGAATSSQWVSGADITITDPNGVVMRAEEYISPPESSFVQRHFYHIALDRYGVSLVPGGTYHLRVTTPDGTQISGTTSIPNATPAAVPGVEQFDRDRDTVRLRWQAVPGARRYEVTVRDLSDLASSLLKPVRYQAFADDSLTLAGTARTVNNDVIFYWNTDMRIVVTATDTNYYEYYRLQSDPYAGTPPSRLTGGEGVFGAIVPIVVRQLDVCSPRGCE